HPQSGEIPSVAGLLHRVGAVVDSILGCTRRLRTAVALSSAGAIFIGCRIPPEDDMERCSRRELPRNLRADGDLAIRSNGAFIIGFLYSCRHAALLHAGSCPRHRPANDLGMPSTVSLTVSDLRTTAF